MGREASITTLDEPLNWREGEEETRVVAEGSSLAAPLVCNSNQPRETPPPPGTCRVSPRYKVETYRLRTGNGIQLPSLVEGED